MSDPEQLELFLVGYLLAVEGQIEAALPRLLYHLRELVVAT